jgi:hypothetical protein
MMLPVDSRWVRGLLLVAGLVMLAFGGSELYRDWRFAQEGRAVRGSVVDKHVRTSTSRSPGSGRRSRTQHYEVTYRFTVDGGTFEGQGELGADQWRQLTAGAAVDVVYLSSAPTSNRLAGSNAWMLGTILVVLGVVFTSIGTFWFIRATRAATLRDLPFQQ